MRKCEFLKSRVDYLGYEVSERGIHASPEKVKAVVNWPRPQSVHDVVAAADRTQHVPRSSALSVARNTD